MGVEELERDLEAMESLARTALDHFGFRRPPAITLSDIKDIHGKVYKGSEPGQDQFYLERYRKRLYTIFDIYAEPDDT
jgi:hypothetical protein